MKIGVGVTTTPKRQINSNLYKFTNADRLEIEVDENYSGVAKSRNRLLAKLQDCDHIFLFDDDCFPAMFGWERYFIDTCSKYGVEFSVLPEYFKAELIRTNGEMGIWNSMLGAFQYQTRNVLDKIGGYNESYFKYGFEDVARNARAVKAGFGWNGSNYNAFPIRGLAYIHSMDVFAECPPPNYDSTEKNEYIERNRPIWLSEINSDKVFFPYD